jgi:hypothetical protein
MTQNHNQLQKLEEARTATGGLIYKRSGAPAGSEVGYDICAMWYDSTNAVVYKNTGTVASATWVALTDASATTTLAGRVTVNEGDIDDAETDITALQVAGAQIGSVTPVDGTDGTASVTIQVLKNDGSTTVGKATRVNCWLSATAGTLGGVPAAADTSLAVATGTEKMVLLAAADLDVLSATNGVIVLTVTSGDTSSDLFCNAEIAGIVISAEVTITGN